MKFKPDILLKYYLRILAVVYFGACVLHVLDLLDLRLKFSQMNAFWQTWIVFLTFADFVAALGLSRGSRLGELMFLGIALTQLAVYLGWAQIFGNQYPLIGFHFVTLGIYLMLLTQKLRQEVVQIS